MVAKKDEHDGKLKFGPNGCYIKFEIFYPIDTQFSPPGNGKIRSLKTGEYYYIFTSVKASEDNETDFTTTIDAIFDNVIQNIEKDLAELNADEIHVPENMDIPEQKVIGINEDGTIYDASGTYCTDALEEFIACLSDKLLILMKQQYLNEDIYDDEDLLYCYERFNAMVKGTTNLLESDYLDFITKRESQYRNLKVCLEEIIKIFEKHGIKLNIEEPGRYVA